MVVYHTNLKYNIQYYKNDSRYLANSNENGFIHYSLLFVISKSNEPFHPYTIQPKPSLGHRQSGECCTN